MKALSYLGTLPQLVESLLYQSQLFQIALNLLVKVSTFGLQVLDCHVVCLQLLKVCQEISVVILRSYRYFFFIFNDSLTLIYFSSLSVIY